MKYKNTKTGLQLLRQVQRFPGKNWELEIDEKSEKKKTPSKNQGTEKDKSQEGTE